MPCIAPPSSANRDSTIARTVTPVAMRDQPPSVLARVRARVLASAPASAPPPLELDVVVVVTVVVEVVVPPPAPIIWVQAGAVAPEAGQHTVYAATVHARPG